MIIEIEGYFQQVLLIGKSCSKRRLLEMYREAEKRSCFTQELPKVFCLLYHFEEIPYDGSTEVDFVIDTDTDRVYSPAY